MKKSKTEQSLQSVAEAERVLEALLAKRAELEAQAAELAEAKSAASFAAFTTGSADEADIESIGHAIAEGKRRLQIAKAFEREAADKTNAAEILRLTAEFRERGNELDAAARALGEKGKQLTNLLMQLHGLGVRAPSFEQFDLLGHQAVQTALLATPWRKRYAPLPPLQHRTFNKLTSDWATGIEARHKPSVAEAA